MMFIRFALALFITYSFAWLSAEDAGTESMYSSSSIETRTPLPTLVSNCVSIFTGEWVEPKNSEKVSPEPYLLCRSYIDGHHPGKYLSCYYSSKPSFIYSYTPQNKLEKISFPDGRFKSILYNEERRIKALQEPLGDGGKVFDTYRFEYEFPVSDLTTRKTIVYDANSNKTIYYHHPSNRLLKIQKFTKDDKIYSTEEFIWEDQSLPITNSHSDETSHKDHLEIVQEAHFHSSREENFQTAFDLNHASPIPKKHIPLIKWFKKHSEEERSYSYSEEDSQNAGKAVLPAPEITPLQNEIDRIIAKVYANRNLPPPSTEIMAKLRHKILRAIQKNKIKREEIESYLVRYLDKHKQPEAEKPVKVLQPNEVNPAIQKKMEEVIKAKPTEPLKIDPVIEKEEITKVIPSQKKGEYSPIKNEVNLFGKVNLIGRCFSNSSGEIQLARFFSYDQRSNIISHTLYGNLTGQSSYPIILNQLNSPIKNGVECYQKVYTYSEDTRNLLMTEKEDNGKAIYYSYAPGTDLLIAKLVLDHDKISFREFREYDSDSALTKIMRDDGCGRDRDDFTAIQERHIFYLFPKKFPQGYLPERIDEMYWDPLTKEEKLLKRVFCTYSPEGYLLTQSHHDSNGVYRYTLSWTYDVNGNILSERNAIGAYVWKEYDPNHNLIVELGTHRSYTIFYTYDILNRLTNKEYLDRETKERFRTSYTYDNASNRISTVDLFGRTTDYSYDEFNRLIQVIHPEISNKASQPARPVETISYDIFGHSTSITFNKNGSKYLTSLPDSTALYSFNAYGKPLSMQLSNGTHQSFQYSVDGNLVKKIEADGSFTSYTRNCFGQILTEETYSPHHEILNKKTYGYHGLRLITVTDAKGLTEYFYDGAGRLVEEKSVDKVIKYEYDSLNRLAKKQTLSHETKIEMFSYDLLGRLIEERSENAFGEVLAKLSYGYDKHGNRNIIAEHTPEGIRKKITIYNIFREPTKIIDPQGNVTDIYYNYSKY